MTSAVLAPEVVGAIDELEQAFPGRVKISPLNEAGVVVCVSEIELGARWTPRRSDLSFLIPYHYPDAAIYPYYVTAATPTGGMIDGLQEVNWQGIPAIQVSLRHTAWNPAVDNAVGSVLQTQTWLRSQ